MDHVLEKGACILGCAPLRALPSDRSEMVTQLLFGETYAVLDKKNNWLLIRLDYDAYEGWLDQTQHYCIDEEWLEQSISEETRTCNLNRIAEATDENGSKTLISFGSNLPLLNGNNFEIGRKKFFLPDNFNNFKDISSLSICRSASMLLNTPYLWGGRSVMGMDCSGFTQIVFKSCGIRIYRDAYQQASQGTAIDFIEEALPGDLAFFDNQEGSIVHVGIIMTNSQIIHACGSVRLDHIDHQGIYNAELNKYTHKLRLIRRATG